LEEGNQRHPQWNTTQKETDIPTSDKCDKEHNTLVEERYRAQLERVTEESNFLKRTLFRNFIHSCQVEEDYAVHLYHDIQNQLPPLGQTKQELYFDSEPISLADDFDIVPTRPHLQDLDLYLDSLLSSTIDIGDVQKYKTDSIVVFTNEYVLQVHIVIERIFREKNSRDLEKIIILLG
jgi:hypothetical protein